MKESLFRLKFKLALGEVDAVKRIREEKKSLARLHTITRQRGQASKDAGYRLSRSGNIKQQPPGLRH